MERHMSEPETKPEPNSTDGLIARARDIALALKESPSRSLARLFADESLALQVAMVELQQNYSHALDVLQNEDSVAAGPPPEDDGVFELPTDRDYEVRVLLHKVKHRAQGGVYIVGAPMGGEFMGPESNPHAALPVKFLTHQTRVPKANGWAARYEAGHLLAEGIIVHVTFSKAKGTFSVSSI